VAGGLPRMPGFDKGARRRRRGNSCHASGGLRSGHPVAPW
jgi:hypothetical protein